MNPEEMASVPNNIPVTVAPVATKPAVSALSIATYVSVGVVATILVGGTYLYVKNNKPTTNSNPPVSFLGTPDVKDNGNNDGESPELTETPTPTPTETVVPTTVSPTPTPKRTTVPTAIPKPTPTTAKIKLVDEVGSSTFEYSVQIPVGMSYTKTSNSFTVKSGSTQMLIVDQRYEGYDSPFTAFTQLSGKLGTYYRVKADGSTAQYYTKNLTKTGSCMSMGDEYPAPCGLPVFAIPEKNFLAAFTCVTTDVAKCDAIVASMTINKL